MQVIKDLSSKKIAQQYTRYGKKLHKYKNYAKKA